MGTAGTVFPVSSPGVHTLYPDCKRIALCRLNYSGLDGQFRRGLLAFRGHTRKWIYHDSYSIENLNTMLTHGVPIDLVLGRIHDPKELEVMERHRVPVIPLDPYPEHEWVLPTHCLDFRKAGELAAEHFLHKGHRHFAFMSVNQTEKEKLSWQGFSDACRDRAQTLEWLNREAEKIHQICPKEQTLPYESYTAWLQKNPRPKAVFLLNDNLYPHICQLAWLNGISIPEDLSFIGQDNHEMICSSVEPHLTSVAFPGERWGYRVAEQIEAYLEGRPLPDPEKIEPQQIMERESTELEALQDDLVARGLTLIRLHASKRMPLTKILNPIPLSARSFGIRFQQALGRSPQEELFRQRVELAKAQLLQTNHTVEHVADDCGFRNAESMAQNFKKWVGMTPSAFRKQNRL